MKTDVSTKTTSIISAYITSDNGEFIHPTCDLKVARGLGERNAEMVQRNHMEQPTAVCVLKAGLHSVMRMTDFKNDAMKETLLFYGTEEAIEEFPFTAEEERPPDLTCDGAAKKSEYVHV
ncbi:hypothetical protein F2Q69_00033953 [Brassica cretica]|uniref:Uncharacterized protein n=1 Tax=Brassica cretica TaxID=69181 RepID=A0A8S9SEV9_BRACR|nr:hypothetical protein F2Q69_00033953 [Brassica cretica]